MTVRSALNELDSRQVIAEIGLGEGLSLAQAARGLPRSRGDRPVHPSTLWRWATEGVRTAGGDRVRLEVARLGCRWTTSKPALQRFLARLNNVTPAEESATARRTPEAVEVALAKHGL